MIAIFKKVLTFLDGPSRWHLGLLFVPMLGVAMLEMASIGMILPFIQVLVSPDGAGPVQAFIEWLLPGVPVESRLVWVAVIFSVLFVAKNIALFVMILIVNLTIQRKLALFIQRLFVNYLNRPLRFHLQRNSAEIIRNLNSSAIRAFESVRLMLMIALEGLMVGAAFALLLFFEPTFTLLAGGILIAYGLVFHRIAGPYFQRWGLRTQVLEARIIKSISEALRSIRDVKLLHVQDYLGAEFTKHTNGIAKLAYRLSTSQHIPRLSVETLVMVGFAAVVLGLTFSKESIEEVVASLGLFGMASLRLMPSMNRILIGAADLKNQMASIDVLYTDLEEAKKDHEEENPGDVMEDLPFEREIRLEDVSFTYPGSTETALRGVTLSIENGESVGVVGPNGAGKSTLLDIILGLLNPEKGVFSVDGKNISSNIRAWQNHLGYVPQHIYLVDDTLKRNIAFGLDDSAVDQGRIDKAVQLSNLGPVIETLADGLDTPLGERGSRLSGGQRQRVAIARALYRDPDVLIFDEATSALDSETEKEVIAAIERLKGEKKTMIIISQKLSLVRNCDKVVFMKEGEIVDIGRFDELVANNPRFRQFAQAGEQTLVEHIIREIPG